MPNKKSLDVLIVMNDIERREMLSHTVKGVIKRAPRIASSAGEARAILEEGPVAFVIAAEQLPGVGGQDLLSEAQAYYPSMRTVLFRHDYQVHSEVVPILRSLKAAQRVYTWLYKIFPGSQNCISL